MSKFCFVIPVYNHEGAIAETLGSLDTFNLPYILVDDGCDESCRKELQRLEKSYGSQVHLVIHQVNGGKGAAVKSGLRAAKELGYSHAIQVDADGQHSPADIPQFFEQSKKFPRALICGYPLYDKSVPKVRLWGRYLTHIWIWINTLSLKIKDSMCGLRCYPISLVVNLLDREFTGDRMDFDPEILVRWYWNKGELQQVPVNVSYPKDGVSHFRGFEDNLLISAMHTRLFFGMVTRTLRISRLGLKV
ncbi:glycosyltransferase family 2 protein [Microbulbifer variabilis]|uniref:glycosyltransferase family 2 protein n=1 Tax=Microbulbifer variabilis TaxID=266805 RepID=UPI001CFF1847|nr:glycosyltransferase family 2 protein [Microbulbifer variabilis]